MLIGKLNIFSVDYRFDMIGLIFKTLDGWMDGLIFLVVDSASSLVFK